MLADRGQARLARARAVGEDGRDVEGELSESKQKAALHLAQEHGDGASVEHCGIGLVQEVAEVASWGVKTETGAQSHLDLPRACIRWRIRQIVSLGLVADLMAKFQMR